MLFRSTLRQLLTMSSGIAHNEDNGPIARTDTAQMLFTGGSQDMAGFAEAKPLEQRPGSAFNYSSATSVIISDLIASRLTTSTDPQVRRDAMATFVRERLAKPGGMPSLTPEYDARGTMIGGSIMHMTARDYARFGELLRNKGRANGRQIVPERWISLMTTPSKANAGYGLHIWLNAQAPGNALFGGGGPPGIFGCVGHNGQYILVSPSQRLTVVRLGVSTTEQRVPLRAELLKLIRMFPG